MKDKITFLMMLEQKKNTFDIANLTEYHNLIFLLSNFLNQETLDPDILDGVKDFLNTIIDKQKRIPPRNEGIFIENRPPKTPEEECECCGPRLPGPPNIDRKQIIFNNLDWGLKHLLCKTILKDDNY